MTQRTRRTRDTVPPACTALLSIGLAAAATPPHAHAQTSRPSQTAAGQERLAMEQTVLNLSKDKWQWMADRKIDNLETLFHPEAVFVHMGGTMTRAEELDVIRSGRIQYKHADVQEASVRIVGTTAIVLNRVRLLAVVGGNEVTNPFVVTEVYVRQDDAWKLASLSFTRLLGQ